MTASDYADQLTALLPRGPLWRALRESTVMRGLLLAIGDGLSRFELAALMLLAESDPRTTAQLLPEWEASTGLPDYCIPGGGATQQRRDALVARLVQTGGSAEAYFAQLAAQYGYTISITYPALHTWRVATPTTIAVVNMTCNGTCNDALQTYGNEQLECTLNRAKPAHTILQIAYGA